MFKMKGLSLMRNVDLTNLAAYDLLDMQYMKGIDATGYLLIHKKTCTDHVADHTLITKLIIH